MVLRDPDMIVSKPIHLFHLREHSLIKLRHRSVEIGNISRQVVGAKFHCVAIHLIPIPPRKSSFRISCVSLRVKSPARRNCAAIVFMVREPYHEQYGLIVNSSSHPFVLSRSKGEHPIATQACTLGESTTAFLRRSPTTIQR